MRRVSYRAQVERFVNHLNSKNRHSLVAEWELAVLYSLSHFGSIDYEPRIGSRQPDVLWKSNSSPDRILADVESVSDEGLEEENLREFYREELTRRITQFGLNPHYFYDEPRGRVEGTVGKQKMRLLYPKKRHADLLFNMDFYEFLKYVRIANPDRHSIRIHDGNIDVTFHFSRTGELTDGSCPAYKIYYSPRKNPIANSLKEKASQLRETGFEGPMGIVLTDAGCFSLSNDVRDPTGRTYSDSDVIHRFLQGTRSISFVLTLATARGGIGVGPLHIRPKFFRNPSARHQISDSCEQMLSSLPSLLPKPRLDGWNAGNFIRHGWDGPHRATYLGTCVMSRAKRHTLKVSARGLVDLMRGTISPGRFSQMMCPVVSEDNIVERWIQRGYVLRDAKVERQSDKDDDYLVLVFEPDVAAASFRSRAKPSGSDDEQAPQ